ncbi:MAG: NADH-ubiquinone oxidoreductase-F iron-sulfur binding region domain-containing protein, partial [Bacteroidota bacterium]
SGGLIVMDETSCMVDVARFFLEFVQDESCGKCVPCREGTARMKQIVDRICEGKGEMKDIDELEKLAKTVTNASLCGLGQTAPNPVLSTLRHFREEYIEHIRDKKCRTAVCKELIVFEILDVCNGCQACKKVCPVHAIHGEKKHLHNIDEAECIRCGLCLSTCKFEAIVKY